MTNQIYKFKGGAWIGYTSVTWPFGFLGVSSNEPIISIQGLPFDNTKIEIKKYFPVIAMELNQDKPQSSKKIRQVGTIIAIICVIIFFVLLSMRTKISGYAVISYPLVLLLGLFFGGLGATGKVKTSAKNLAFFVSLVLIIVLISLAVRKH